MECYMVIGTDIMWELALPFSLIKRLQTVLRTKLNSTCQESLTYKKTIILGWHQVNPYLPFLIESVLEGFCSQKGCIHLQLQLHIPHWDNPCVWWFRSMENKQANKQKPHDLFRIQVYMVIATTVSRARLTSLVLQEGPYCFSTGDHTQGLTH